MQLKRRGIITTLKMLKATFIFVTIIISSEILKKDDLFLTSFFRKLLKSGNLFSILFFYTNLLAFIYMSLYCFKPSLVLQLFIYIYSVLLFIFIALFPIVYNLLSIYNKYGEKLRKCLGDRELSLSLKKERNKTILNEIIVFLLIAAVILLFVDTCFNGQVTPVMVCGFIIVLVILIFFF